ncbi:MAG: prolyl oligopeptidase family serine peptidase [Cyclobacteriaceae bacterium]
MDRTLRLALFLLFTAVTSSYGQKEYEFKTGLAVTQCHRYGREAITTDHLAYSLYTGRLQLPREYVKLFTDTGKDFMWKKIEVDSTGKFRGEVLMNGYIYLTYNASRSQNALLNVTGNIMLYFNGEPRGGDIYSDGWMTLPVKLKRGVNEIFIRCGNFSRWQGVKARLLFPEKTVLLGIEDATLPHVVIGRSKEDLPGAVVIINSSDKTLDGLSITANLNGKITDTPVAAVSPSTIRKAGFYFNTANVSAKGDHSCDLQLKQFGRVLDDRSLVITAVNADQHQSHTFVSDIDGSVQYYGVAPYRGKEDEKPALFLSVHGAGVQAIGQARAYQPKDWGVLVAPTNRRPRGFNWEDWGRIDALEVLEHATEKFTPDPERIYLTGHSMGGHGTWYLGATHPDKWAAIAPCAGYPTLTAYGSADGRIPDSARTDIEKTLLRASNASNVLALARNYKNHGVYIFHGDEDRTVPVRFARQMRDTLGTFHPDFSYYEYPGGSHWFGNESVDWPPLFEYFRWHTLKHDSAVNVVDFTTANPAISSTFRWASVIQQHQPLAYSNIHLSRDKTTRTITGTTRNVAMLKMDLNDFNTGDTVSISLDSENVRYLVTADREVYLSHASDWRVVASQNPKHKNALRSGPFKEAFRHRMIFVYGTAGKASEDEWGYNKARYDAEVWYYRGNGAVDIIRDQDFNPAKYPDRGIVLYGNSATNSAWNKLLNECPIQVFPDRVTLGAETFRGIDLATYFVWPRPDSDVASVAVISGTGLAGLNATEANQYFAAGSGFPDYMIFSLEMLKSGAEGIKAAGFFGNDWR